MSYGNFKNGELLPYIPSKEKVGDFVKVSTDHMSLLGPYEIKRFLWNAARYCFQRAGEEQDNMLRRDYQTAMRLLRGKISEI